MVPELERALSAGLLPQGTHEVGIRPDTRPVSHLGVHVIAWRSEWILSYVIHGT